MCGAEPSPVHDRGRHVHPCADDEAGAAVSVFKGLELVLNNKGESSTIPKMLHLANDFLLRAVKPSLEKKEHKQAAVGLSLLVDLAIDFFGAK